MSVPTVLKKIITVKREEIHSKKIKHSLQDIKNKASQIHGIRPFYKNIYEKIEAGKAAIIAEIKKASPSKGLIRPDFDPKTLAESYEEGGATCISVLTDAHFFQGNDDYINLVKSNCQRPVLRKDFIVDPWQVYESKAMGADCILLIVAALEKALLHELYHVAMDIGLDILVEVHHEQEVEWALELPGKNLLGINNRNLHTFETTLQTTYDLLPLIPQDCTIITESGISQRNDVLTMMQAGVKGFLIGESFMRAQNPGEKLADFFKGYI